MIVLEAQTLSLVRVSLCKHAFLVATSLLTANDSDRSLALRRLVDVVLIQNHPELGVAFCRLDVVKLMLKSLSAHILKWSFGKRVLFGGNPFWCLEQRVLLQLLDFVRLPRFLIIHTALFHERKRIGEDVWIDIRLPEVALSVLLALYNVLLESTMQLLLGIDIHLIDLLHDLQWVHHGRRAARRRVVVVGLFHLYRLFQYYYFGKISRGCS